MLSKSFKAKAAVLLLAGATGIAGVAAPAEANANPQDAVAACKITLNDPQISLKSYVTGSSGNRMTHTKFGFNNSVQAYTGCVYRNITGQPEQVIGAYDLTVPQEKRMFDDELDAAIVREEALKNPAAAEVPVTRPAAQGQRQVTPEQATRQAEQARRQAEAAQRRQEQALIQQQNRYDAQERRCEQAKVRLTQMTENAGFGILRNGQLVLNRAASQAQQIANQRNEVNRQCAPLADMPHPLR